MSADVRDRERITTVVDRTIAERLRALAVERGASLSRIVDQALIEYLDRRPLGSGVSLLAERRRGAGRPSRADTLAADRELERMRKRTGRPLRSRADGA